MAYDEHDRPRPRGGGRERDEWRNDRNASEGRPHPQRLGDRDYRGPSDDPDYGSERYGAGPAGSGGFDYGPSSDPDSFFGAPGFDPNFAGPRFDRQDVGSTGTHGVHPVSSAFGADYRGATGVTPGGGFRSSARRYAELQRGRQGGGGGGSSRFDPHYAEWRRRQIEQLDRDYDDYHREHQSRFDEEFGAWRERRSQQRQSIRQVREHMEVVGSDDSHIGTVDCTRGDRIILTRSDPNSRGYHHSIPCSWVESVEDKVRLNVSAAEAMDRWREEEHSGALFESGRQESEGPHILNRSFSGTYRDRDER